MTRKGGLPKLLKSDRYLDAIGSAGRKEGDVGYPFGVEDHGHAGLGRRRSLWHSVRLLFQVDLKASQAMNHAQNYRENDRRIYLRSRLLE